MTGPSIIPMATTDTAIDGVTVITQKQVTDERGTVREFFRASVLAELAGPGGFQQINVTETRYGAIRGLHGESMLKLVGVVSGSAFGAYLDARKHSPTYGQVATVDLVPGVQVVVPEGVCNGFQVTSPEGAHYLYAFTSEWVPGMAGVAYQPYSPGLAIPWPVAIDGADPALLSSKDATAPDFTRG